MLFVVTIAHHKHHMFPFAKAKPREPKSYPKLTLFIYYNQGTIRIM